MKKCLFHSCPGSPGVGSAPVPASLTKDYWELRGHKAPFRLRNSLTLDMEHTRNLVVFGEQGKARTKGSQMGRHGALHSLAWY